jgi:hypothetical protein
MSEQLRARLERVIEWILDDATDEPKIVADIQTHVATLREVAAALPAGPSQEMPCSVCGNEERDAADNLTCECPCHSTLPKRREIAAEMRQRSALPAGGGARRA